MKDNYSLLFLLFPLFLNVSCSESEDPGKYENWRERNEAFIDSLRDVFDLKTDSELKALIYSRDKKYNIYYKVLKNANHLFIQVQHTIIIGKC